MLATLRCCGPCRPGPADSFDRRPQGPGALLSRCFPLFSACFVGIRTAAPTGFRGLDLLLFLRVSAVSACSAESSRFTPLAMHQLKYKMHYWPANLPELEINDHS